MTDLLDNLEPEHVSPFVEIELADGHSSIYRRHDNRGGHVALDAQAHSSALVAHTAWVDSRATLRAGVRVGHHWPTSSLATTCTSAGVVVGAGSHLGHHVTAPAGRQLVAASEISDETWMPVQARASRPNRLACRGLPRAPSGVVRAGWRGPGPPESRHPTHIRLRPRRRATGSCPTGLRRQCR